ncbi:MAG: polysaccharide biosynthesis C-terminal domain-containing protein, partial [Synergistaceae bacterium]|nr:polysaccharide biosynthesis C-terminal domain-containing protein [Synergistaceae bacterium]
ISTAIFSLILVYPMGYNGLALAPGIAFTLSGLLGLYYVRKKLARSLGIITLKVLAKYIFALAIVVLSVSLYKFLWPYSPDSRLLMRALWVLGVIIISAVSYFTGAVLMKFEEYKLLRGAFVRKK